VVWLGRKKTPQFFSKLLKISGLTFPYDENFPARFAQLSEITFVAFNISPAFVLPKFFVCGGFDSAETATVHMPETAVNKNYFLMSRQNNIGFPRKFIFMETVPKPQTMNQ
jgi:hypothetical protein